MRGFGRFTLASLFIGVLTGSPTLALEPGQSEPKRLYSIGDSATRAVNADLPFDNLNLSWVSGYFGFWEEFFGLPNIKSHNQRISANFGSKKRKNWIAAENGAEMDDMVVQAAGTAGKNVTYATVLLGANDLCEDSVSDLPTDAQFEAEFRAGMDTLLGNLSKGATVQVIAIFDVTRVYDVGKDKEALGIVDCQDVWEVSGLCGSILSPDATDADREFVRSRNISYNQILKNVTQEKAVQHPGKFISFTDLSFTYPFTQKELSDIDCYHPSHQAQKILSREAWNAGFFKAHQKGK